MFSPVYLHIETEDGDSSCVIILVEHSLKFHVQKIRTFLKTYATGGIKTAGLLCSLSALEPVTP